MANPFKVLGLDPSVLRGLTDPQIRILAQGAYRTMARVHHEDVSGSDSVKMRDINEANHLLEDEKLFQYHKKRFLKKRKDRIRDLEDEIALKEDEFKEIQGQFLKFWGALVDSGADGNLSVFNLAPMRILLSDKMEIAIRKREQINTIASGNPKENAIGWRELEILKTGDLCIHDVRRVFFDPRRQDPPDVPQGWRYISGSPGVTSYYVERTGKSRPLNDMKIIGTIKKEDIEFHEGSLRDFSVLLPTKEDYQNKGLEIGFPWHLFRVYCRYIRPEIESHRTLVGITKSKGGELRYVIMGEILGIWVQ